MDGKLFLKIQKKIKILFSYFYNSIRGLQLVNEIISELSLFEKIDFL